MCSDNAGTLPIMGVAFFFMLRNWLGAVNSLADYQVRSDVCWVVAGFDCPVAHAAFHVSRSSVPWQSAGCPTSEKYTRHVTSSCRCRKASSTWRSMQTSCWTRRKRVTASPRLPKALAAAAAAAQPPRRGKAAWGRCRRDSRHSRCRRCCSVLARGSWDGLAACIWRAVHEALPVAPRTGCQARSRTLCFSGNSANEPTCNHRMTLRTRTDLSLSLPCRW